MNFSSSNNDIFSTFLTTLSPSEASVSGSSSAPVAPQDVDRGAAMVEATIDMKALTEIARRSIEGHPVSVSWLYSDLAVPVTTLGRTLDKLSKGNLIRVAQQQNGDELVEITDAGKILANYVLNL